jgi:putative acyl-CoA dehydrogenase
MSDFFQAAPELHDTFKNDTLLVKYLKSKLPQNIRAEIFSHLEAVGVKAATHWLELARVAEAEPPQHIPYDSFGHRIDEVRTSAAWRELLDIAAREGIVATAYERKYQEWSRVYQAALLYLYHPSSAIASCPLAMTDGAARALELYADKNLKERALTHLVSRDPKTFWTSGQWMTEKTGGSDVSNTETIAKSDGRGGWTLHGTKWFTSAVDAKMAMLLARPEGAAEGNKGLSLFYCELRNEKGRLNQIEVLRLKNKLGTHALPTAELRLLGTPALMVGDEGRGVSKIASLFNITRVYNSLCATSHIRRGLDWAKAYGQLRKAFGKKIEEHVLHKNLVAELEGEYTKCFWLTFTIAELLGRDECGVASEDEKLVLRALTPLTKLYTAKKAMMVSSEVVEIFGGVGYCEDSGMPALLRDAQVLSIWEGTTNVLCLDFLRALFKEQALEPLINFIKKSPKKPDAKRMARIEEILSMAKKDKDALEGYARELAFEFAEVVSDVLNTL